METLDYDRLMRANLSKVFGEQDAARRHDAIVELYAEDAVFYEPDSVATGHAEIAAAVADLLNSLPPFFVFSANGPAVGHHGVGRLRWSSGPAGGPAVATGTDVAHCEGGKIRSLHVFLDPPGA